MQKSTGVRRNGECCSTPTDRTTERTFMTTPPTSLLSEPAGAERVPLGTLAYFRARSRGRVYDLVVGEFVRSGLSQADLARRLGKGPDVICRWLGSPGNWSLDTVSDLLFAISGAEPTLGVRYPLKEARKNYDRPEWLESSSVLSLESEPRTANTATVSTPLRTLGGYEARPAFAVFELFGKTEGHSQHSSSSQR